MKNMFMLFIFCSFIYGSISAQTVEFKTHNTTITLGDWQTENTDFSLLAPSRSNTQYYWCALSEHFDLKMELNNGVDILVFS